MKEKPHYYGHRKRLAKRLRSIPSHFLEDYEILEGLLHFFIPRKDTKPLAKKLLKDFHSLEGIFKAPQKTLLTYSGIGSQVSSNIKLVDALYEEFIKPPPKKPLVYLNSLNKITKFCRKRYVHQKMPHCLYALGLNTKRQFLLEKSLEQRTFITEKTQFFSYLLKYMLSSPIEAILLINFYTTPSISIPDGHKEHIMDLSSKLASLDIDIEDYVILNKKSAISFKDENLL